MKTPRIALIDIETAPCLGYVWGKWQQDVIDFKKSWYMLSFGHKWLGERSTTVKCLVDYPRYNYDHEDDRRLVKDLWKILDEADIIIAHNGDKFDIRKSNARFIAHSLRPPSPYKSIDTLRIARKYFRFDSNRLDDLGSYLGVGRKLPNTGKHLWFGCMRGDESSWDTMRRYNAQDIALLERVYLKLRPWHATHPKLTLYTRREACPACQSEDINLNGKKFLTTGYRQQFLCKDCGHQYSTGPLLRFKA